VHQTEHVPDGRFLFFEVRFPEDFVTTISPADLEADWRNYPPRNSTVTPGANWLKARSSPVLQVPSIMIPEESNFLLNPEHPRAEEVKIGDARPFTFDPRFLNPPVRAHKNG